MNGDSCAFIQSGCIRFYQSANYQCTTCSVDSYSASGTGPGECDYPWYLYPQVGVYTYNTFLLSQTKKQGSFLLFFMLLQTKVKVCLCKESCFIFLVCNNQKFIVLQLKMHI